MVENVIRSHWVGRVVDGRFPLLEWRGGSAETGVFLTEWDGPGGPKAAIKLVAGDHGSVDERLAGWAAAAELSHPHLTRVFHSGRDSVDGVELAYVVTEFADEILGEIVRERPLTPDETREMLAPVLETLAYLHGKGLIYGHLKPSNIMAVDDRLKLAGDDVHRSGATGPSAAAEGIYAAPETAAGSISPAADLWSLGATVVEVLTQRPPAFDAQANRDAVVPDSLPEPFDAIVRACLRREPAERATLHEVRAILEGKAVAPVAPAQPAPEITIEPAKTLASKVETTRGEAEREGDAGFRLRIRVPAKSRLTMLVALLVVVAAAIAIFALVSHKARHPGQLGNEATAPATAQPAAQPAGSPAGQERANTESQSPSQSPNQGPSQGEGQGQGSTGRIEKGGVADRVMPDVPANASRTIQGKVQVEVRVVVDTEGRVANAEFASQGVSRYFANLALEAARRWRFAPARAGGQAVRSVWVLRFVFRENGTEASAEETSP